MSGWSGASILFYPERYDWFYLYSLIGSDQCSQLMSLGLQDCPRKAAHSVSSLLFLTLLLVFVHFDHFSFAACDTLDLVGKNEVLVKEKITLQRLLIVFLWIDKVQCQMGGQVSQEKWICHCSWTTAWKTTLCLATTQYVKRAQTTIKGLKMGDTNLYLWSAYTCAIFHFINANVKHRLSEL